MHTVNFATNSFPNLFYRKVGSGPAVVLLHGFPEDGSLWDNIYPVLAANFRVIIPDIPGSGQSSLSQEDTTIEALAEAVHSILDREQISSVVLVGHSMGGYVALAFAEKYPEYVQGLSLVHSSAAADMEDKKEVRRKAIALIRKGGREPFIKSMIPNLFAPDFQENHPEAIQRQIERGMKLSADSIISFYNAMIKRPDRTNLLKESSFPVQFVIGRQDSVMPLAAALEQSRLAVVNYVSLYNNCGHMSMLEQPELLSSDLKDFITYCHNR